MKKHKKSMLIVILLLLVAIATAYVGGTYAKYTGNVSGNGTASVAKWNFEADNPISTLNINFTNTYDDSTLAAGKIAPGTSGSFLISLKNTLTETGVEFTLALGDATNVPTNLKFYKDASFSTEITQGSGTITGQLAAKDGTGINVPVYWKWEYETKDAQNSVTAGDTADTISGKAETLELTIPVTITGTQLAPSATAITSHINNT